jgi:DeoR/GlpR family transcriptional regulator of sugar metabolism
MRTALIIELIANRPILRRKDLAQRYGVSERTIDRWKEQRILPRPSYIKGAFWTPSQIADTECRNAETET